MNSDKNCYINANQTTKGNEICKKTTKKLNVAEEASDRRLGDSSAQVT